jgi:hypothetical protein
MPLNNQQNQRPPAPNQTKRIPVKMPPQLSNMADNVNQNMFQPFVEFFFSDPNKQKVLASTQDHLDIYDIKDNLIILKNGDMALVVETTAVNFQLLSSYEQDMKVEAFSDLINSLNFDLQIVIHTEPIDMRRYLNFLEENFRAIERPELKTQMRIYINFVKDLVLQNNILQKRFFVVIPHRSGILTADQLNPFQKMTDVILGRKRVIELKNADNIIEDAKIKLFPKRDSIMKLLSRIGLGSKQLTDRELINLFYSYYNPITNF